MIHPVLWLFLGLASSPCIIARTRLVYTPSHFVAALADVTVDKVQVEVPLVALTEDVFQRSGVRVPVSINRTVTVVGSPQLPEWPMLQFMAWHTVELCAGVTLLFTNVIIQYYVLDSPARTPNLYLFAPSKAPNVGPNGTRVVLQAAVLILPSCLPVRLRSQNLVPVERPIWEGPGPQIAQLYPMKTSCSNSTDAPVLERCWQAGMLLQQDYAYPGAESASDGTVVANNVTLRFLDVSILCQQEVTDECLVSLGPYGCLVYVNRLMSAQPPVPISAQMRAIIAQQQQQAESGSVSMYAPAAGGVPASTTAEGGSSKPAVLAGAVAGGVAGAALLLAAAATAFLSYRRRKRLRPDKHHQGRLLKRAGPADVTGHCDSKRHQEGCGNTHSVVVFYGPDATTDDSSSSYADSASSALTPAVPLPAAGGQGSPGPPGSQPQQHADASWRLPDLVVSSAPLRAGLETEFVVVSRGHAADAPADITAQSMAPGLPRSCAAGYGKQGAATPSAAPLTPCPHGFSRAAALVCEPQQHPQCRAEAAREGTEALRAHALFASTGSSTRTGASAGTGSAAQPAAALTSTYASALAVLWLGSTNMESLLTASSGADPSPGTTENAATPPDFGDAARNTDAVVEPAAQVAVSVANEAAEVASKGTPAAAVSLLPPPLTLGEELPAPPVEVVELLPHRLGKGSFGRVLEGRYRGQRVAVKQALDLHDGLTLPVASVVASFLQEVQVMGRCTHPNITTLLAACLAPPKLCLVMELMDASLEALIFGGPPGHLLPLPKVLHIAIQMARGLEYLHPTVIHRDLKPSNVLISNPGDEHPIVKLTDFGLSKISEMTLETAHPEAGTPAYLAPECFDITNNKLTHQVDMYAFAVCIWAMLTGEIPWKNHNVVSVAYNVHMGRRPPLDLTDDVRCPRKLRKLIEQCWDAEPRRRPAAAEAVKELLVVREQLLLLPSGK